jgi:hypothetical protein
VQYFFRLGSSRWAEAGPASSIRLPAVRRASDDPNLKKYCTGDYMTYCGNLPPESPEVDRCFEKSGGRATSA